MYTNHHRGFTYIELLVVVALFGIILSFGMAMNLGSISRTSMLQERDLFVSLLLTGARAQALANIDEKPHGIYIDNDAHEYILFEGTDYTEGAAINRVTSFTSDTLTITNTGGNTILFEQLSGDVSEGVGTITISGNGATQYITINAVGQINW